MDPFSMVYDALWGLLEQSSEVTSMVKPGNRIKFSSGGSGDPIKHEIMHADMPELVIVATAAGGNLHATSSTTQINRQYEIIVTTGDLSVVRTLHPLEFAIACALTRAQRVLGALVWPDPGGQQFVKVTRMQSISSGFTDSERNRNIRGWSSVWGIDVEMHFATSALQALAAPPTTTA